MRGLTRESRRTRQDVLVSRVFLAAEAGQRLAPQVIAARAKAAEIGWAAPSLRAHEGRASRALLESAAASIATSVGAPVGSRVMFFPGAPIALQTAMAQLGREGTAAVTSAVERQVILNAAAKRNAVHGLAVGNPTGTIDPISVDALGRPRLAELARLLPHAAGAHTRHTGVAGSHGQAEVGVVVLAVGNAEVGTLAPLSEVHELCRAANVALLVDATMAAGRTQLPPYWDALVVEARSWAGGEGVAALVLAPQTSWRELADADVLALPYSAPSVPDCAGAALGLEVAVAGLDAREATDRALIERLRAELTQIPDVLLHGDPDARLPHVLGFSLAYIDAEALLLELDRHGIAVASGSACAARSGQPSHVLAAMGALTSGNVRITLPIGADASDVDELLRTLPGIVARMRSEVGL